MYFSCDIAPAPELVVEKSVEKEPVVKEPEAPKKEEPKAVAPEEPKKEEPKKEEPKGECHLVLYIFTSNILIKNSVHLFIYFYSQLKPRLKSLNLSPRHQLLNQNQLRSFPLRKKLSCR